MAALVIIDIVSGILAFFVSKSLNRRALFWAPFAFFFPVILLFLLQVGKEEKIGRELAIRATIAFFLMAIAFVALESIQPGNGIISYETYVLDHASLIMNAFEIPHLRTGFVFQMPSITMEAPSGNSGFYIGPVLVALTLISGVFVRSKTALLLAAGIVLFGVLGHILSAATFATVFGTIDSPEQLRPDTLRTISQFYIVIGIFLLFVSDLAFAYFVGKKIAKQNQAELEIGVTRSARSTDTSF